MAKALALASLAAFALGLLWTVEAATHVESVDQVRRVDPWAEKSAFTFTPLAPDGTALAPDAPGYFTTDAPRLRVAHAWSLDDPTMERVSAMGTLALVVRGATGWTYEAALAEGTLAGAKGDALVMTGEIDLVATKDAILSSPGRKIEGAEWAIVARIPFASAPTAAHASDASEWRATISYTPPLYLLPSGGSAHETRDHAQTEVTRHETRAGLAALAQQPAAIALLAGGLLGLGYAIPRLDPREEASA